MNCLESQKISIEQVIHRTAGKFSRWIPGGTGLVDCAIVSDDLLSITVYEHNRNIRAPVENKPKLILYALGTLLADSVKQGRSVCNMSLI